MHRLSVPLLLALLCGLALALPNDTPLCPVRVTVRDALVGEVVTVTPTPTCPLGAVAVIRFRSRTGSQPDNPPGYFFLKRGQQLTRLVPRSWWIEERTRFFRNIRVIPTRP